MSCHIQELELGFRLEITLWTRTCPTVVFKHMLIPTERPINKAGKGGAAQIELGESLEPPAAQLKDTQKCGRGLVEPLRL